VAGDPPADDLGYAGAPFSRPRLAPFTIPSGTTVPKLEAPLARPVNPNDVGVEQAERIAQVDVIYRLT
jgi:hypothetical protein